MFGVLILPLLFTGQLVVPELRSACPTTQVSGVSLRRANKVCSKRCCEHLQCNNKVFQRPTIGYQCGSCACGSGFAVQHRSTPRSWADVCRGFVLSLSMKKVLV